MILTGTEVKSLRLGNASISDSYCLVRKGEIYLKKLYIAIYEPGTSNNHEPIRDRKLLLKRAEIRKIERKLKEKGYTVVPLKIYFGDRGYAKIEIALAQGKKTHDKRESIRQKDNKRELDRLTKYK
ncbi:UNVERIFIED_CONTAM: hypothetical protein GTU68_029543 [Idotea baltica]|nr:hypothetical protein [Idotea baltica]